MYIDIMIIDCGLFRREVVALAPAFTNVRAGDEVVLDYGKKERRGRIRMRTTVDSTSSEYRFIMHYVDKGKPFPKVVAITERRNLTYEND